MGRRYEDHEYPSVTLNDALTDYYELRLTRLAETTRKAHEGMLERMRTWLVRETYSQVQVSAVDDRAMTRYYNRMLPPACSASTYNSYRQYGNLFWKFCLGEGWVRSNPMRHVDPLRVPQKTRLLLSPDEMLRMIDAAEPRDRVALALGMNTALRAGDIARLTIGSVNLGNNLLTTEMRKSKISDELPITSELRAEILRWLPVYASRVKPPRPWETLPLHWKLVPPIQQHSLNVHALELGRTWFLRPEGCITHPERIVQRALDRLGHPTHQEGFHTLRRSMLRALHDLAADDGAAVPIRIAQAMAGHKSQQTTERYLGITHERRLRDEMLQGRSFLTRAVGAREEERGGDVRAIG